MNDADPSPDKAPDDFQSATATPKMKSSGRLFIEDLIVSGCGMLTSAAVAYGSRSMSQSWNFSPYTWMANWVIPAGAIACGFVAAVGYWIGARWFNHRPSRMLLGNIVLVSLTTFFAIHHLDYSQTRVKGVPLEKLMGFGDYLIEVTEHMTYKSSHDSGDSPGTELGKWGWGVAGLQIIGFSFGGFAVYGMLAAVPYCDRCSKYLSDKRRRVTKWKDVVAMRESFETVSKLMQGDQLQMAIDQHAGLGEQRTFGIKATLVLELRKCPGCENRRLRLTAQQRKGNQWATVGQTDVWTEAPLQMT